MLSFSKLKYANQARNDEHYKVLHTYKLYLSTKLSSEVGGICTALARQHRGVTVEKGALERHMADLLILLDITAQECGVSLESVVRDRFNETSKEIGSSVFLSEAGEIERRRK